MPTLNISPSFTIDDIRAIRTYNYEMTKGMTGKERDAYYDRECQKAKKRYEEAVKTYALEREEATFVAAEPQESYLTKASL